MSESLLKLYIKWKPISDKDCDQRNIVMQIKQKKSRSFVAEFMDAASTNNEVFDWLANGLFKTITRDVSAKARQHEVYDADDKKLNFKSAESALKSIAVPQTITDPALIAKAENYLNRVRNSIITNLNGKLDAVADEADGLAVSEKSGDLLVNSINKVLDSWSDIAKFIDLCNMNLFSLFESLCKAKDMYKMYTEYYGEDGNSANLQGAIEKANKYFESLISGTFDLRSPKSYQLKMDLEKFINGCKNAISRNDKAIYETFKRLKPCVPAVNEDIFKLNGGLNEHEPAVLPTEGVATLTLATIRDVYCDPYGERSAKKLVRENIGSEISLPAFKCLGLVSHDTQCVLIVDSGYNVDKLYKSVSESKKIKVNGGGVIYITANAYAKLCNTARV